MTELEKMVAGKLYESGGKEQFDIRYRAHRLCKAYNATDDTEKERRREILEELLADVGEDCVFEGPIFFDYGIFSHIGKGCYANVNFTVLDTCPVTIGDNVYFGPNCTIATPMHPLRWQERNVRHKPDGSQYDLEYGKPVTVGANCWIASNVVLAAGVTVGEGCVIGAGSVVTRDLPPNVLAVGNPCRVVREITEADSVELKKELY